MSYNDEINGRSQVPLSILSGYGAIEDACAEVDRLRTDLAAARAEAERAALWAAHLKLHLGELQRKVADFARGALPAEWKHKSLELLASGWSLRR